MDLDYFDLNKEFASFDFTPFPKISRLFRPIIVTEKIDGTNAAVVIRKIRPYEHEDKKVIGPGIVINTNGGKMDGWEPLFIYAQSRKRVISPEDDNFGFAQWVRDHAHELVKLGTGVHFGEWWGAGIQRKYGLAERRFSLFNVLKWGDRLERDEDGECIETDRPTCCHVVPVLATFEQFDTNAIQATVSNLIKNGSAAAPGFMDPEGIVTYHKHSNSLFKTTVKDDDKGKEQGA